VPEWEAESEEIRATLTKSYETLYALYADQVVALPQASQVSKATEERLRLEILAGELGSLPKLPGRTAAGTVTICHRRVN
jgi:hypothetical protein